VAIMMDRFAIITGEFKAQTLLGKFIDTVVTVADAIFTAITFGIFADGNDVSISLYDLEAYVHQTELVITLREGGLSGAIVPEGDLLTVPYEAACNGEIFFLSDEDDIERMCMLDLAGQAFLYGLICVIAFIVLVGVAMVLKSRKGRWRYYIGAMAFLIGVGLVCIFVGVMIILQTYADCLVLQMLQEKLGIIFYIADVFHDSERWCFSHDDSFMNIEMDESLLLVLIAGIIMCCAGLSFCCVMNCCIDNEKTVGQKISDTIRGPFKKKKGFVRFK